MSKQHKAPDPRVVRSQAAVVEAARALFLRQGYAGTTMAQIAAAAGLTKRTVYNNYPDKDALFTQIVRDVTAFADAFAADLRQQFTAGISRAGAPAALDELGRRLALGILRPEVIEMRRLLIGEARQFPQLARDYFERAPGQVLDALTSGFTRMAKDGALRVPHPREAAAQFAYLVAGELLDRAVLTGTMPTRKLVIARARDGVETFLSRYRVAHRR